MIWRRFPGLTVGFALLMSLVLATLTSSHPVFPFFPLFPVVLFLFATRIAGRTAAWHGGTPAVRMPTDDVPALQPSGIDKEKELLEALERHGEITAVRAAIETSLSVTEAEEMLSGLANKGHVRVSANGGRLAYALWE
jgi:hypothetical protein